MYGTRRKLKCEYLRPDQSRNRVSPSDRWWNGLSVGNDRTDAQAIDYPTTLFLDPGILQHGQIEIHGVASPIPAHILQLLGNMDKIRVTASKYFQYIHLWMPFVSKKRFFELYLQPSYQSRSDVVLLLLSLKLRGRTKIKVPGYEKMIEFGVLTYFKYPIKDLTGGRKRKNDFLTQ